MNSLTDLRSEFAALAAEAPDAAAVRAALAAATGRRDHRRHVTAMLAVAAAVVLLVGGIAVTSSMLQGSSTQPAGPSAVVPVPEVPLPADTQLVRHTLPIVESPVTATPPAGLTGQMWFRSPGRLAVSWFQPTADGSVVAFDALNDDDTAAAGYVITDDAADAVFAVGPTGPVEVTPDAEPLTIAGHAATLESAVTESGSYVRDQLGFPAAQRISWQLADGRYVHAWAKGPVAPGESPDAALRSFAESIVAEPQELPRSIGIGLTLPGYTIDSSININPATSFFPGALWLCRTDVDPMFSSGSVADAAASGGTSGAVTSTIDATSMGPDGTETTSSRVLTDVDRDCLSVTVAGADLAARASLDGTTTTVAGSEVSVQADLATAVAHLDGGMLAAVAAPPDAQLSAEDLAALAASVRFSPHVQVLSADPSQLFGESAEASASSVAVSSSAAPYGPSGALAPPPIAPVSVLHDAAHPIGMGPAPSELGPPAAERLGTISFFLRNVTEEPVTIDAISLGSATVSSGGPFLVNGDAGSLTLHGARARLDNVPSDAAGPLTAVTAPMLLAPGSTVMMELDFAVGSCAELPTGHVQFALNYSATTAGASSSGGGFSLDNELGLPNWVHDLTQSVC